MPLYFGCRVSELLDLKNLNIEERCFDIIIASKTRAGIRKVPIAKKTFSFFNTGCKRMTVSISFLQ